jgi:hypothetical protein
VWKLLAKVLIDKTARHFDVDNSILEEDLQHVESSVVETPKKRRAKKQADIEPLNSQDL